MDKLENIKQERKRIRTALDIAYTKEDNDSIIAAAIELSRLAQKIMGKNSDLIRFQCSGKFPRILK